MTTAQYILTTVVLVTLWKRSRREPPTAALQHWRNWLQIVQSERKEPAATGEDVRSEGDAWIRAHVGLMTTHERLLEQDERYPWSVWELSRHAGVLMQWVEKQTGPSATSVWPAFNQEIRAEIQRKGEAA